MHFALYLVSKQKVFSYRPKRMILPNQYPSLFSGLFMCLGDVFAQLAVDHKVDWKRTLRFTGVGLLCLGPMMHAGRSFTWRLMKWKDTNLENRIKIGLLSNLTVTPTSYITTIGLISWSQYVPTWNQIEKKIWDEAPYAVGASFLVIMNILMYFTRFIFENWTI